MDFFFKLFNKFRKINFEKLPVGSNLIPSLIDEIYDGDGNGIYANILTYSYEITKYNKLEITIDIDGISKYNNEIRIGLLDKNEDTEINIVYSKNSIIPSELKRENNYAIYTFNLPDSQKNIKIKIIQSIQTKRHANLYFTPRNYVKDVNMIKIKTNNKRLKCYKIINRKCEPAVNIPATNGYATLNTKEYIKSIFLFEDYNH